MKDLRRHCRIDQRLSTSLNSKRQFLSKCFWKLSGVLDLARFTCEFKRQTKTTEHLKDRCFDLDLRGKHRRRWHSDSMEPKIILHKLRLLQKCGVERKKRVD